MYPAFLFRLSIYQKCSVVKKGQNKIYCVYLGRLNTTLTIYNTIPTFNDPEEKAFENIVGKEENAGNQHFLLFPQCFLSHPEQILPFGSPLICRLQNALNLDWSKILSFGKVT